METLPAGARADKPYLAAWLGARYSPSEQAWIEMAEMMIESLVQERKAARRSQIETSERRQEMEQMRAESLLLRLEAVLARAAGKSARSDAVQNRSVALLFRNRGAQRRSALLQKLRP